MTKLKHISPWLMIIVIILSLATPVIAEDGEKINMANSESFSNCTQQILGNITGLEHRNAHFYILVDISASTTLNDVSNNFRKFYDFLIKSFFNQGDTITLVPFARHIADDKDIITKKFVESDVSGLWYSPASLASEKGTDIYEPLYKTLEKINAQGLKDKEYTVILSMSDRTSNDVQGAYETTDQYYPNKVGIDNYNNLLKYLESEKRQLTFTFDNPVKSKDHAEVFYLSILYADNIDKFPAQSGINRERDLNGETLPPAHENKKDIEFYFKKDANAKSYVLYISQDKNELKNMLTGSTQFDKEKIKSFNIVKAEDVEGKPNMLKYTIMKSDLLKGFDTEDQNMYYSIRSSEGSRTYLMRELIKFSAPPQTKEILIFLEIILIFIALVTAFMRGRHMLVKNTKYTIWTRGSKWQLKCLQYGQLESNVKNTVIVDSYNQEFNQRTLGYLSPSPKFLPPLLRIWLKAVGNDKEKINIDIQGKNGVFSEGTNRVRVKNTKGNELIVDFKYESYLKKNAHILLPFLFSFISSIVLGIYLALN